MVVFEGMSLLARGTVESMTVKVRETLAHKPQAALLIFEADTGRQTELDLHSSSLPPKHSTANKASSLETSGPGRPKLGVVGREVTLLPRHWEWLGTQPGGASVALRKLVEHAMKANLEADSTRQRKERAYQFMSAMAGNLPHFEEAIRALFAGDEGGLQASIQTWPVDVRSFAWELATSQTS